MFEALDATLLDGNVVEALRAALGMSGEDGFADVFDLGLAQADFRGPVLGGGLLDILHGHEALRAAGGLPLSAQAVEVGILSAVAAAGEADAHTRAAVATKEAPLEVMGPFLRLLA
nr:hypothetical protein [Allorhizocola rhizosphaerae]